MINPASLISLEKIIREWIRLLATINSKVAKTNLKNKLRAGVTLLLRPHNSNSSNGKPNHNPLITISINGVLQSLNLHTMTSLTVKIP